MARRGGPAQTTPSSGSQFYITLEPQPGLDGDYTVFGQATADSMPVVEQIKVGDVIKSVAIEEK
ncbi:MAG: peptidylprolyl isomerase [Rudaea sp.]